MSDNNVLEPGTCIRPILDSEDVKKLVFKHYGFKVTKVLELNGYDDKNYHLVVEKFGKRDSDSVCSNEYVFKVINSLDSKKPEFFEAQNLLLLHLSKHDVKCPQPIPTKEGSYCKSIQLTTGTHIIRLLEYIDGVILHEVTCTPEIFYQIGTMVAKIDVGMQDFYHPIYDNHKTLWMLDSTPNLTKFLFSLESEKRRLMCQEIIKAFEVRVLSAIGFFEKGMIHGDINEQNILVEKAGNEQYKFKAILDFGDSHFGCYLFELAITMTYMILEAKDLKAGAYVIAGYLSRRRIPEQEYALLKICIAARLCQSLIMGAYSYSLEPQNSYLLITAAHGWTLLEDLWRKPEEKLLEDWKNVAHDFHALQLR